MGTFERIQKLVVETLGADLHEVTLHSHLYNDLNFDSLDQIDLLIQLDHEFSIMVGDDDAAEWKTVADVVAYIDNRQP